MAVMTGVQKNSETKEQDLITKKNTKSLYKSRPITATLDHPLILDIKLLKKLDMTTFTKKGLIALSKFCGISLITTTDTKKKLNRTVKTVQHSKKQFSSDSTVTLEPNKTHRTKRKFGKQGGKTKPRIRFKVPKDDTSPDEDSLDVVCRKHMKVLKPCNQSSRLDGKNALESILKGTTENVVPEPCRTCNRSEHPERFHSHPKVSMKLSVEGDIREKTLEEKFRYAVTTKEDKEEMKRTSCAKDTFQEPNSKPPRNTPERNFLKLTPKSPSSSITLSSPETGTKSKTCKKPVTPTNTSKPEISKKCNSKAETIDDLRFVTGCYVCGKEVSPKLRIKHEKTCITEWRTQNSLVSPDKRKPEPKRPDFRFTGSGDVDFEGTFESIWANHMDSLVPCKKCGRKFFPDRIERHENCCNNVPINNKNKH